MMCRISIFALLAAAMTFAAEGDYIPVNASVDSHIDSVTVKAGSQTLTLGKNATISWQWVIGAAYSFTATGVATGYTARWQVTKSGQTTLSGGAGNSINLSGDYAGCALSFYGEPNEYTVTLYQLPGGGGTSSVRAKYDQQMPTPIGLPTRTGYTFNGYCADPNGGLETRYYTSGGSSVRKWNIASDTTLYAWWSATEYTVTLDMQGGSNGTSSVRATYDQQMPAITVPKRMGYTFNGYYTGKNGQGTRYYMSGGASARIWDIASATTLYASWTAKTSTVNLDKQSGSNGTSSVTATYDATMPSATMPTRTGYSFGGYYSATGGSGTQYYTAAGASARNWDKTNSVVTLYAKWTANTNTVTLDQQGGSGGSTSVTTTYNVAMPSATMPTRTGYTFDGYYTGQNGSGTQYYTASGGSAANWHETSVTRLYAKWTANTYTVTFDANGGSVSPDTKDVTYGSTYGNLPTPTLADHSFAGWFTAPSGGDQVTPSTSVSITGNQILYARWAQESYEVQYKAFDKTGESIGGNFQIIGMGVSAYLTSFNDLAIRHPDGYSFKNWNTALDGSGVSHEDHENVFNLTNVANTIVTLYAQWEPNPYQVAFWPNGADESETMTNQWFTYDVTQALDQVGFTYTGYTFKGWSTITNRPSLFYADGEEVVNLATGGVVNLYANWTGIVYTVTFDANGGEGTIDSMLCTYDVPTNLPAASEFTPRGLARDGWGFKGWTNSLAEGVLFLDRARVTNLTTRAEEVQMYACWTGVTYAVTLDARDPRGDGVFTNSQDEAVSVWTTPVVVGDAWNLPMPTNVDAHLSFSGWTYVDTNGVTITVAKSDLVPPPSVFGGETNLVAAWDWVVDDLAAAVDAPEMSFSTRGTVGDQGKYDGEESYPAEWFAQTNYVHDSTNAVQSGREPWEKKARLLVDNDSFYKRCADILVEMLGS